MKQTDILIMGAGASGLMAAIAAGRKGAKVVIVEKMPRPGRKIMISGKGRCNLTNLKAWNEFSRHIHPKPNFLKPAFYSLSSEQTVAFFEEAGLKTVTERGDRVFPASYKASDVVDCLQRMAGRSGAELLTGTEVRDIKKDGNYFEALLSNQTSIRAKKIIIATGGLSYPGTGSTGDGYRIAEKFGHKIRRCFPSLTALVPVGYKKLPDNHPKKGHIDRGLPLSDYGKLLEGVSLKNVGLRVLADGNLVQEEFGDLDFTDGGIEGPIGFKVSRKAVNMIDSGSKLSFILDMKPAVELSVLHRRVGALWKEISLDRRSVGKGEREKLRVLTGKLLPAQLSEAFLSGLPRAVDEEILLDGLCQRLKGWKFDIAGYVGYERCVITAGGVATDEVVAKTLESKLLPGLYFAGEVLDIDGDTGGYNLQTAFSTGYLAGLSAARATEL